MRAAAEKAGRALRRDFGEIEKLQVSQKGPGDFVTNADLKAESIIREELQTARPGYGLLMEESGEIEGSDKTHRWIVDPLDGTTNFMHGIPHFAISIALEREGRLVAGLIYNPVTDEMFFAERGQGAFSHNTRLRVGGRNRLSDAVFACGARMANAPDAPNSSPKWKRFCRKLPAFAALVRRHSIWLMWPPVALTGFGNAGLPHGIWLLALLSVVRRAGSFRT